MASSQPNTAPQGSSIPQGNAPYVAETPQQQAQPTPGPSYDPRNPQPSNYMQPENGQQNPVDSWAAVEGEMKKEDEAVMKGHMEDIDYLLVFAGLFSAVLTAFVVESYQQLQPDNEEISTELLRRISIQLESFTLSRGFANSTLPVPDLPSLDFTADKIARWINILWFLSLIFSLAAALFGILVKQWIREYMRWNAALAHPRDNVLVRQIRFEAWNDWSVPTIIAVVPALLEIALVFFVCGLVVLLWTLDPVVSIVITTAAAVFLAIAATFTFLPAFFRRCPYKSPTAWACAILWDFLTRYIPYKLLLPLQQTLGDCIYRAWNFERQCEPRIGNWAAFADDWRSRDLANLWWSLWPGAKYGSAIPLLEELRQERAGPPTTFEHDNTDLPAVLHDAQRTITELSPLVRALAWVYQASHEARTQAHVVSCVDSLETRFTLSRDLSNSEHFISKFFDEGGVRAVSYWHLTLDVERERARVAGNNPTAHERKDVSTLRAAIRPVHLLSDGLGHEYNGRDFPGHAPTVPLLARLLMLSCRRLLRHLSDPSVSGVSNRLRSRNLLRLRQYDGILCYYNSTSGLSVVDMVHLLYETYYACKKFEGAPAEAPFGHRITLNGPEGRYTVDFDHSVHVDAGGGDRGPWSTRGI